MSILFRVARQIWSVGLALSLLTVRLAPNRMVQGHGRLAVSSSARHKLTIPVTDPGADEGGIAMTQAPVLKQKINDDMKDAMRKG